MEKKLEFRGGMIGLFIPFIVLAGGIMWLALSGKALPMAFWTPALAALLVALLMAKDPTACAEAIIKGMASEMVAIMLMAWFLAGIIAKLLQAGGLVQGLVWLGISVGLSGALFPAITFIIGSLVSTATGTAIGSVIALGPVMYPVGVALGANPPVMVAAIVCGAYFGDNIAPVSDTTIASAYTQGTEVAKVVRTRLKYAFISAAFSIVLFIVFGGGGTVSSEGLSAIGELSPNGLIMILVPALLIFMMFRGSNLIIALMTSGTFGIILGVAFGLIEFSSLMVIDMNSFSVGGILIDGISGMIDISVFAFIVMGLVGLLERGGLLEFVIEKSSKFTKTPRSAELTVIVMAIIMSILTLANTIVILMVGPLSRKILHKHKITKERRANILDAVTGGVMCVVPFAFGPILAYMFAGDTSFSLLSTIPYMFHGWGLIIVMTTAAITGWGRETLSDEDYQEELSELENYKKIG